MSLINPFAHSAKRVCWCPHIAYTPHPKLCHQGKIWAINVPPGVHVGETQDHCTTHSCGISWIECTQWFAHSSTEGLRHIGCVIAVAAVLWGRVETRTSSSLVVLICAMVVIRTAPSARRRKSRKFRHKMFKNSLVCDFYPPLFAPMFLCFKQDSDCLEFPFFLLMTACKI